MRTWLHNVLLAIRTIAQGMYITLWYFVQTYRRKTFTERYEYPELPVPVKPRYRGYSRDGCIVDYAKLPLEVAWGQATLNPTAVAASKLTVEPVWVKPLPPAAAAPAKS